MKLLMVGAMALLAAGAGVFSGEQAPNHCALIVLGVFRQRQPDGYTGR